MKGDTLHCPVGLVSLIFCVHAIFETLSFLRKRRNSSRFFKIFKVVLNISCCFQCFAVRLHIRGMLFILHVPLLNFTVSKTTNYFLLIVMVLLVRWGHTFLVNVSKSMLTLQRLMRKMMTKIPQELCLQLRYMKMKWTWGSLSVVHLRLL